MAIILIAKPLSALLIVAVLGHSARTALTVALGLAQIGEFSFILGEMADRHGLVPPEARHLLVACALVSITINPLLFRAIGPAESWLRARPRAWALLNGRSEARARASNGAKTSRSAVSAATSAISWTRARWPRRSTRPARCSSRAGFHGSS